MDLAVSAFYEGFDSTCAEAVKHPIGPFEACPLRVLITTSQFARVVSTVPIKAMGGSW
jgi:hypothetical protein